MAGTIWRRPRGSGRVGESVAHDGVESGLQRQFLMAAEPLCGVAMSLDVEAISPDPVEPDEGGVECPPAIVIEAWAALRQAAFGSAARDHGSIGTTLGSRFATMAMLIGCPPHGGAFIRQMGKWLAEHAARSLVH